ncbi:MAG: hypothetical protein OEY34_06180, partial [Cyclobacteriaceae bacterium]|nr:hypothetical protein [Cyclobacteriaceae bacterium]
ELKIIYTKKEKASPFYGVSKTNYTALVFIPNKRTELEIVSRNWFIFKTLTIYCVDRELKEKLENYLKSKVRNSFHLKTVTKLHYNFYNPISFAYHIRWRSTIPLKKITDITNLFSEIK